MAPEPPYLYLKTRGRRSGLPREIEIWFTQHAGNWYVIAEFPSSHWIQNVRQQPRVEVRVAGQQFPATARILDRAADGELAQRVQELSRAKYGWGDGLVVELKPLAGE